MQEKENRYLELLNTGLAFKSVIDICVKEGKIVDVMEVIVFNWSTWTEEDKNKICNYLFSKNGK